MATHFIFERSSDSEADFHSNILAKLIAVALSYSLYLFFVFSLDKIL